MFLGIPVLLFIALAAWRLANLVANETGPFHVFKNLRSKIARAEVRSRRRNGLLSKLHLYEGINCEYCSSIWWGILFGATYRMFGEIVLWVLLPLAISTGAILIKHVVYLLKSVDTRFDQQNQAYLKSLEEPKPSRVEAIKSPLSQWTPASKNR